MLVPQPKVKTVRNLKYLAWLRQQPCQICGTGSYYNSIHAHHSTTGGMGIKGDDSLCVPLCTPCHQALHQKLSKKGPWSDEELEAITTGLLEKFEAI